MPDMLEARSDHASVSIKNKLYVIGGSSKQCEVLDSFSRKFIYIKPISNIYEYKRFKTQCVTMGNSIKIFNKDSLDAAVYDVEEEEWCEEKGLQTGIASNCAFDRVQKLYQLL